MSVLRNCRPALIALLVLVPWTAMGQEISQTAVNKAHDFLKSIQRGQQINNVMHFGTTYVKHEFVEVTGVKNSLGRVIPGEFALTYRFWWDQKYSTDFIVFCTASGSIDGIRAGRSDGIAQAPFLASQATIAVIGNVIYESIKNDITDQDRRLLREIIDRADTRGLLEMQLKVQQALEK